MAARPRLRQTPMTRPKAVVAPKAAPISSIPGFPTGPRSTTPGFLKIPETATPPPGVTLSGGVAAAAATNARDPFAPDEVFTGEQAAFGKRYGSTLGALGVQENQEAYDSGFSLDRKPSETLPDGTIVPGAVTGFHLDPSNPFSKASLLQRSYENSRRATQGSFAARGHLYSGGRIAAQASNAFRRDQSDSALRSAFQRFLSSAAASRTGARDQYDIDSLGSRGRLRDRNSNAPIA